MGVLTWIFGLKLPEREPAAPKPDLQPVRLAVRNDDPAARRRETAGRQTTPGRFDS